MTLAERVERRLATWIAVGDPRRRGTIFNCRGRLELFGVYGFKEVETWGAGDFPLPARFGRIDIRHSAFITAGARK